MDIRIFIVPPLAPSESKEIYQVKNAKGAYSSINTLAHYIAMYDDLYFNMIYTQFSMNPLITDSGTGFNHRLISQLGKPEDNPKLISLLD